MTTIDYSIVTELAGNQASAEQLSMIRTRYELAASHSAGKDVLEVACGPGRGLGFLAKTARSVIGGDRTRALVEAANRHYQGRVKVVELDAQRLDFADSSLDTVILFEALYYLPDFPKFLTEARRVLRPGGTLLLCSANREWPDFNPSPFSVRYLGADELRIALADAGFAPELFAAFSAGTKTAKARILSRLKRLAMASGLMPKSMKGKALFKRIFFGPLAVLGPELDLTAPIASMVPLSSGPVRDFKVLYAIARRD